MIDMDELLAEAEAEVDAERSKEVKTKLKASLRRISDAEKIVANLKAEHEVLLRDLGGH